MVEVCRTSQTAGRLLVVSGPSGVGKDTLLERVLTDDPRLVKSVSATTRAPRPGEIDGRDYHFVSRAEFNQAVTEGAFYEFEEYGDNLYGTPRSWVDSQRADGKDVVLKIEVKGARHIRRLASDTALIFIRPPSMEELERKLRARGSDTDARIQQRLAIAREEMEHISDYDYVVVNDDLDGAVQQLKEVIHRVRSADR